MPRLSSESSNIPLTQPDVLCWSALLCDSYRHFSGKALVEGNNLAVALYHAPFALVSHRSADDPVFCYANLTAQRLWDMGWEEFTRLPSRLSAEPAQQAERAAFLKDALQKGMVDHYEGVRISRNGMRFLIQDTSLWNVCDPQGMVLGQAAKINQWQWI